MDGKYLARHQIVICLGLTADGRKIPMGLAMVHRPVETSTENAVAIEGLFQDLIRRGLTFESGILCIIDGSKGLHKAVFKTFGDYAAIRRCQWHKRENVTSYLSEKVKPQYRRRLQNAYEQPTYEKAKAALLELHTEIRGHNRSAANSMLEGLEETLTLLVWVSSRNSVRASRQRIRLRV